MPGPGNPNVSKIDQLLTSWRFLVKQGLANYDPRPNLAHSLFVSEDLLEHNHVHLFMLVYGYSGRVKKLRQLRQRPYGLQVLTYLLPSFL